MRAQQNRDTPIIGRLTAAVDSSSIDTLAGLSKWPTLRTPPDFCAIAGCNMPIATSNGAAAAHAPKCRLIAILPANDRGFALRRFPRRPCRACDEVGLAKKRARTRTLTEGVSVSSPI